MQRWRLFLAIGLGLLIGGACLWHAAAPEVLRADSSAPEAKGFEEDRFEKEILVGACEDPMGMDVFADGSIVFIERNGNIKRWSAKTRETATLGRVPVAIFGEVGMMGVAADLHFEQTGWLYLLFCPAERRTTLRLSRFTVKDDKLIPGSEKQLLDYPIDEAAIHMGGGLALDGAGNLYAGTGDNCVPVPVPPVDQRPGHEGGDAFRTAANSADLRGKVLRIHPEPDGRYTIPQGNLFADGKEGRPEVYAMGCRNPFRIAVDRNTGWLYFGDVGPNMDANLGIACPGYDEINQARAAGNFGWPLFNGPNEALPDYDFTANKPGPRANLQAPVNRSRNNTGAKRLPPPLPAFIWYSTTASKDFPELGSGGRSGMVGPVYHFDAALASPAKLPASYDNTLFIFEWMRNWIKAVHLDKDGRLARITPFLPGMSFRKPMDMKLAPDGSLYLIEYGAKWTGNQDAQIVRIAYYAGNRPPVAVLQASPTAGKQPLRVLLDGSKSFDKDPGDRLTYSWRLANGTALDSKEATARIDFDKPGVYEVRLTVTDSQGAMSTASTTISVGNAAPVVRIAAQPEGGFFDWGEPIAYRVRVDDEEDGSTADGRIAPERVVVRAEYQARQGAVAGAKGAKTGDQEGPADPGLDLMRRSTCFSCHTTNEQSKGPPYAAVAKKYHDIDGAREQLARKVLAGGAGVWGAYPMPPHPQHTLDETRRMVGWVLNQTDEHRPVIQTGIEGVFLVGRQPPPPSEGGVYVLTASYTDQGAAGVAPLTGTATQVLHARRRKAAYFDYHHGAQIVDDFEGEKGLVAYLAQGDYIGFAQVSLAGIDRITCRAGSLTQDGGVIEVHRGEPAGPLLGRVEIAPEPRLREATIPVVDPGGVQDLYFVASRAASTHARSLALNWVEFHEAPAVAAAHAKERAAARKRIPRRVEPAPARAFVRDWTMADLAPGLAEVERGRSFERGKALFTAASCINCHKIAGAGGTLGPDLTEVGKRMAMKPQPRQALLTEILEPSKVIEDKYRTYLITTVRGQTLVGIIVSQDEKELVVAANPTAPEERSKLRRDEIEQIQKSDVSLMPLGLLNTLSNEEVLDLIAYLESGGDSAHPAFKK